MPHGGHYPLAFMHPSLGIEIHNSKTQIGGDAFGWLSIPRFVDEVTRGAEAWLAKCGNTARVSRNMEKFARLRLEGLPPHVAGGPVIA